jgi:hypothetical protein
MVIISRRDLSATVVEDRVRFPRLLNGLPDAGWSTDFPISLCLTNSVATSNLYSMTKVYLDRIADGYSLILEQSSGLRMSSYDSLFRRISLKAVISPDVDSVVPFSNLSFVIECDLTSVLPDRHKRNRQRAELHP